VEAPDDRAGELVPCPECGKQVRLPDGAIGLEVGSSRKCPGCKRQWPTETVVCVNCGYNFKTKSKTKARSNVPDRVLSYGIRWLGHVRYYRVFRNERDRVCLNVRRKFFFVPVGNATYDLGEFEAIVTDYRDGGDEYSGVYYLWLEARGGRRATIFKSADEEAFHELLNFVSAAGGLQIKRG
jgi:hypothetical protein